jgi:putative flavoprotein involved in K+ transport
MKRTDTLIIGGGQAGLAMSRCLSDRGVDHVVLERGRVAERWRSERWDSLRLLTPNWQTRLPGFSYDGPSPDGYMAMPELVGSSSATPRPLPRRCRRAPRARGDRACRAASACGRMRGDWRARNVVIATGYSDVPYVPPAASRLSPRIVQVVPTRYRNPEQLPPGGVLVVGASATGIQLAEEIHASGRPVTLAVGGHLRMPRTYRGRDILWWLDAMGIFERRRRPRLRPERLARAAIAAARRTRRSPLARRRRAPQAGRAARRPGARRRRGQGGVRR